MVPLGEGERGLDGTIGVRREGIGWYHWGKERGDWMVPLGGI